MPSSSVPRAFSFGNRGARASSTSSSEFLPKNLIAAQRLEFAAALEHGKQAFFLGFVPANRMGMRINAQLDG
jgi:hypothetical protein